MTKEQLKKGAEARISDYVCFDCGIKYLTPEQIEEGGVSTFSVSTCGICEEKKGTTHIRHYNYLRTEQL